MFNLGYKWLTFIFEYLEPKMRVVLLCLCIHQIQYLFISVKIWHKAMISWIVLEEMNLNNNCRWLNQTPCCCFYWTLKPGKTFSSIARLCCLEFLKMLVMAHLSYKKYMLESLLFEQNEVALNDYLKTYIREIVFYNFKNCVLSERYLKIPIHYDHMTKRFVFNYFFVDNSEMTVSALW